LILASDGLWDVLTNEEVCEAVRRRLARGHGSNASSSVNIREDTKYPSAHAAAEYLSRLALRRNSRDNVTVVVVDLRARRRPEPTN
jgi:protein phosphatase 2C